MLKKVVAALFLSVFVVLLVGVISYAFGVWWAGPALLGGIVILTSALIWSISQLY